MHKKGWNNDQIFEWNTCPCIWDKFDKTQMWMTKVGACFWQGYRWNPLKRLKTGGSSWLKTWKCWRSLALDHFANILQLDSVNHLLNKKDLSLKKTKNNSLQLKSPEEWVSYQDEFSFQVAMCFFCCPALEPWWSGPHEDGVASLTTWAGETQWRHLKSPRGCRAGERWRDVFRCAIFLTLQKQVEYTIKNTIIREIFHFFHTKPILGYIMHRCCLCILSIHESILWPTARNAQRVSDAVEISKLLQCWLQRKIQCSFTHFHTFPSPFLGEPAIHHSR